jgi:multiple sugar transport system permease protein
MAQRTDTQALPAARPRRKWSPRAQRDMINGILFALPWIIGLAVFWIYPILASFYYSFNDFNAIQNPKWVGLANYTKLFKEPEFLISAYKTF